MVCTWVWRSMEEIRHSLGTHSLRERKNAQPCFLKWSCSASLRVMRQRCVQRHPFTTFVPREVHTLFRKETPSGGKNWQYFSVEHVVGDEEGQLSVRKGGYQCQLAQAKENLPTTSDKVNILRILSCYLQMKPSLDSPVRWSYKSPLPTPAASGGYKTWWLHLSYNNA